jgi:hypothetical protein
MAYVADNLVMLSNPVGGGVIPRVFVYQTTSDADATIVGAGYFSDGVTKGMRVGDLVDVIATTGPKYKRYQVASVSGAAATVAAPTAIT